MTISTDGKSITGLHIEGDKYFTSIPSDWHHDPTQPILLQANKEISEYFAGKRKEFALPISTPGTDFQKLVWSALAQIPSGALTTYSQIAAAIGKPKAVRAVGNAVGRNPICLLIPCHRVIASDGTLGGFVAGVERKAQLLQHER